MCVFLYKIFSFYFCCIPYIWYVFLFSFVLQYFKNSFWFPFNPFVVQNVLFSFHVFVNFPFFLLLLISGFIHCGHEMILIFLNLLGLLLLPNMQSILENFLCVLEKNVCSPAAVWEILRVLSKSTWSIVWFKSAVFLYWFSVSIVYPLL